MEQQPSNEADGTDGIVLENPADTHSIHSAATVASNPHNQVKWSCGETTIDRDFIQFLTIYLLIAIIVITSLANLTIGTGRTELWASLLSVMCGVIVPQPKASSSRKTKITNNTNQSFAKNTTEV